MIRADGSVRKRRRSLDAPGHAHFLTFSCEGRRPLLDDDQLRRWMIDALDRSRRRLDYALLGYVLMPEHAHLIVLPRSPEASVAAILQSIKQPVGVRALRARPSKDDASSSRRVFWQRGGGFDRNLTTAASVRETLGYIHANPVRRALVAHPEDWPWSSARHYAARPDALLPMDAPPRRPHPPDQRTDA